MRLAEPEAVRPDIAGIGDFKYSVIMTAYNEDQSVREALKRTAAAFEAWDCPYEIIIVDDGSTDRSWEIMEEEARLNPKITAISLVRNYGQHPAMFCALKHSTGDFVMTIDADLQNPPEEMIKLMKRAVQGNCDLIFGRFVKKRHSLVRRMGSRVIGLLNEKIFGKPKDLKITNFRLMSRDLVTRMCGYRTAFPYINGLALKFSSPSRRANVLVEHCERKAGKSAYTPARIARLVFTILFNYSSYPLVLVSTIGFIVAFASFLLGVALIVKRLIVQDMVPGWTSLFVLMSFFNGIVTLLLGMLGEYVIRILNTVSYTACYEVRGICKVD